MIQTENNSHHGLSDITYIVGALIICTVFVGIGGYLIFSSGLSKYQRNSTNNIQILKISPFLSPIQQASLDIASGAASVIESTGSSK